MLSLVVFSLVACGGGGSGNGDGVNSEAPRTFFIGGTVSGLAPGAQVALRNNGGDPLTLSANGSFSFTTPVAYNGSYAVTVGTQPAGQSCSVQNGTASNVGSNVSSVSVSCTNTCATTLSGVLSASATYGTSGSPYCISGSLQIPGGIAVRFDPGTSVSGGRIVVQGALSVLGTAAAKARMTDVDVVPAGLQAANHNITITFADISRGSLYAPTGNAIYGSLTLTDSRVSNLGSYLYLWYPLGVNTIARNVFVGSGGISYGLNFPSASGLSLSIVNNHFSTWTTGYAVQNWAQYGTGAVVVEGNTFASTSQVAVMLPGGYTDSALAAPNNYWGTTDTAVIEQMIYDRRVDVTSAGYVTFTPFLSSPAASTPTP